MTKKTKEKVVVTGGAGFIGSHLVTGLVNKGYSVVVLDDLSTGKEENIRDLLKRGSAELHRGSINNTDILGSLFDSAKYVFHLAAMASVPMSIENPLKCHETNSTGTLNVLTAARDAGVRKVIYASSCAIYGDTETVPVSEKTLPQPQSPYAVAKLNGEHYCRIFSKLYGLPTVSLRFFNIYGPGQDPNSQYSAVIPLFIKMVKEGKPPVIDGDGEQTRDFIFIKDIITALIVSAESDCTGEYNIGSGNSTSINDIAQHIIALCDNDLTPEYGNARQGDIRYSYADITRITGDAGFRPEFSLEEGLKRTIDSMR